MPSRPLTPEQSIYWGVIRSAAADRATTAQLWERISAFEAARGISRPEGLFQAVSVMRSLATSQRTAQNSLSSAGREASLDTVHIAQEFNARPLDQQALAPVHVVRFEAEVLGEEGVETRWLSFMLRGYLPATKGELVDLVDVQAPGVATGSREIITGLTGRIELTAQ